MLNRPVLRFTTVNLLLSGLTGKFKFAEQELLRGNMIVQLEAFTAVQQSVDAEGRPLISAADSLLLSLTLLDKSVKRYDTIPYRKLIAEQNAGAIMQPDNFSCNWANSTVNVPQALATPNTVVVLGVGYCTPAEYAAYYGR